MYMRLMTCSQLTPSHSFIEDILLQERALVIPLK